MGTPSPAQHHPATTATNPPFLTMRYMIRVDPRVPTSSTTRPATRLAFHQRGDVRRRFPGASGIARFEVRSGREPARPARCARTGRRSRLPAVTSYTTDWALPASTWTALGPGPTTSAFVRGRQATRSRIDRRCVHRAQGHDRGRCADRESTTEPAPTSTGPRRRFGVNANWTGSTGETGSAAHSATTTASRPERAARAVVRTWTSTAASTSVSAVGRRSSMARRTTSRRAWSTLPATPCQRVRVTASPSTPGLPSAPTLVSPPAGQLGSGRCSRVVLDLRRSTPGQLTFEVCFRRGLLSRRAVRYERSRTRVGYERSLTPSVANGSYWWRARARTRAGNVGAWSRFGLTGAVGDTTLNVSVPRAVLGRCRASDGRTTTCRSRASRSTGIRCHRRYVQHASAHRPGERPGLDRHDHGSDRVAGRHARLLRRRR